MIQKKDLPTLSDSDIVTNIDYKKTISRSPMKFSTIALALALTTMSGTLLSSCSDGTDCDSDVSKAADLAADTFDPTDTTDSDVSTTRDSKPCD